MRFIPTKIHGLLDYIVAAVVILIPFLLHFNGPNMATYALVASGLITIAYSLLTDYEWGCINVFRMPMHLRLDLISGILLAVSPWLLSFSKYMFMPHLVMGILEIIVSLMSVPLAETDDEKWAKKKEGFYR